MFSSNCFKKASEIEMEQVMQFQVFQFKVEITSIDNYDAFFLHEAILLQKKSCEDLLGVAGGLSECILTWIFSDVNRMTHFVASGRSITSSVFIS